MQISKAPCDSAGHGMGCHPIFLRYSNTLLHKDKDLSANMFFYRSVPDDKHSNTQYIRQENIIMAK